MLTEKCFVTLQMIFDVAPKEALISTLQTALVKSTHSKHNLKLVRYDVYGLNFTNLTNIYYNSKQCNRLAKISFYTVTARLC